jgi:hypothetical protein
LSPPRGCPFATDTNDSLPPGARRAGIRTGINPFCAPLAPGARAAKPYKGSPYAVDSSSRGSSSQLQARGGPASPPRPAQFDPRAGSLAMLGLGLATNKPVRWAGRRR